MNATGLDADVLKKIFEDDEPPSGVEIATDVVALARMSPGDPDPVNSMTQGLKDEIGAHGSGAGDADDPDVGRILHSADPGQVSGPV